MSLDLLRSVLLRLRRSEHGMALPTALFATVASIGLAGAAVVSTIDVQRGTKRDSESKNAIAAADAGASVARMRLVRNQTAMSTDKPCVAASGAEGGAVGGWCPVIGPERVGRSTYTYQFSAAGSDVCGGPEYICLVSTGTADGVTRRVLMTFLDQSDPNSNPNTPDPDPDPPPGTPPGEEDPPEPPDPTPGGGAYGLIGQDQVTFSGNANIRVGVGTNGNLSTSGNTTICGPIRVGVGKQWTKSGNASQCSGFGVTKANEILPPVSSFIPATIATVNSNYRLVRCKSTKNPVGCELDSYSGGSRSDTVPWNPSTRVISASGNTTITLTGSDYWICGISLSGNSELIMQAGTQARLFFDTPENCKNTSQINLSGNNRIAATGYQPDKKQFEMPGFFLLGSPTWASSINLSGNYSTTNEYVVYAPNTAINISGNATTKGLIAGKTINMSGNGKLMHDTGFVLPPSLNPWTGAGNNPPPEEDPDGGDPDEGDQDPPDPPSYLFVPQRYTECSGMPGAGEEPDADC